MRPAEFLTFAIDILKNTPDVQRVQTLAEAGDSKYPFGLAVTVAGREQRWQVLGQLAEGARHDTPTPAVEGQPAAVSAAPVTGAPDAWLAGVLSGAESPEIAALDVWSIREGGGQQGLAISWHNGEKTYIRKV
ncbi:hypothetical protein [Streptomyces longispororuber]|uniref:hypothetical protein n=1 Tax=Streptomyces longispororuber TaxID=68230 RepID=UPI003703521E